MARKCAEEGKGMPSRLGEILCAFLGVLFVAGAAPAQTPATPPGALAPEAIQPWRLPPPPPGIGPVELFADIHDSPQGKFLEGGAFDTDGNFWFVAIDTGWVSYLTPAKQLVPVFNCDPRRNSDSSASPRARAGPTESSI